MWYLYTFYLNLIGIYLKCKIICIPESFNTNISYQLFDYTITFVIPNTRTQIQSFLSWFCTKNSLHTQHEFLIYLLNYLPTYYLLNCIRQTKSKSKIYISGSIFRFYYVWLDLFEIFSLSVLTKSSSCVEIEGNSMCFCSNEIICYRIRDDLL